MSRALENLWSRIISPGAFQPMTRGTRRSLIVWASSILLVPILSSAADLFSGVPLLSAMLSFSLVLAVLIATLLTTYLAIVFVRWVLSRLFWSVGRRLALSYLLLGLLPFLLFAVLVCVTGYIGLGVMSQTSFRAARQQEMARLQQANLEYVLTGEVPKDLPEVTEVYDSRNPGKGELPDWLGRGSFAGTALRGDHAVVISAKTYLMRDSRRVVALVVPMQQAWRDSLENRSGIRSFNMTLHRNGESIEVMETDPVMVRRAINEFVFNASTLAGVSWIDFTPFLTDWETGEETNQQQFFLISNPYSNLLSFYLGSSSRYLNYLLAGVLGVAMMLALVYLATALVAVGMILSITRAVNRIQKGTAAVESGDLSYRIGMKQTNQLGDVATSFDRMTASISTLLEQAAEQERLRSEIEIAASIQQNLLPDEGPEIDGVEFAAYFEPTAAIGGDYYDVFVLSENKVAVAIGDVAGHGLSTGIVMAMVKAAITTLVEEQTDEEALFRRLNALVFQSTERRAFMTLGFTIFDLEAKTISHTNAGHVYPYILRAGCPPEPIEGPSLPLGIRPGIRPITSLTDLREGDTLVYLSDGIIEAVGPSGDPFGFERLETVLEGLAGSEPIEVRDRILAAVDRYGRTEEYDDDRTVMILRFTRLGESRVSPERETEDEMLVSSAS